MKRFVLPMLLSAALPAADSRIVPALNAFTADAYRQVAPGDANLILSPCNVAAALSMVLVGARGRTAEEVQSVLHVHYDPGYDAALGELFAGLAAAANSGANELLPANVLWVQQGFPLQPAFVNTLSRDYRASVAPVDFMGNLEAARSQINAWIEAHTKEKIKNLFPAGSLAARTRMVLASAIYFYGEWQDPFAPSRTAPASFKLASGTATQADFMNQTGHFGYAETSSAQVLEMPYSGTGIAFDVLLPKAAGSLPELEQSLTGEALAGWLGKLANRRVEVSLPKFRAESQFSLAKTLAAMGMPTAFTDKADFSGIAPKMPLELSAVLHKAFVDVSERGTEAAAATGIGVRAAVEMAVRPLVFRADHPFVFLIRDTRTGIILFIGRLSIPK